MQKNNLVKNTVLTVKLDSLPFALSYRMFICVRNVVESQNFLSRDNYIIVEEVAAWEREHDPSSVPMFHVLGTSTFRKYESKI
jgi:hypothetical protein